MFELGSHSALPSEERWKAIAFLVLLAVHAFATTFDIYCVVTDSKLRPDAFLAYAVTFVICFVWIAAMLLKSAYMVFRSFGGNRL